MYLSQGVLIVLLVVCVLFYVNLYLEETRKCDRRELHEDSIEEVTESNTVERV